MKDGGRLNSEAGNMMLEQTEGGENKTTAWG